MRFNRRRRNITCSCVSVSSGSPENRTQRYSVISRVWATSPRLPLKVGHSGVEPEPSCSRSRRAPICTSARLSPVRTAGFEPAISRSPTWRDPRLRHVLIKYPVGESNPNPTGIRSPSADPLDGARSANIERCGLGGARTLLSGSSDRRYTVSATSPTKKARRLGDTGLWQKSRYFDGRVSQAPVAHGEGIRRLTGEMPRAFLFANVTRPQGHHFWLLLLKAAVGPLAGHLRH